MVKNAGNCAGDEVVQLYLRDRFASMTRPVKELAGFKRIHMEPGEKVRVTFTVQADQSAFLDRQMRWKVEKGEIDVEIGSSSEDIRLKGTYRIYLDKHFKKVDDSHYAISPEIKKCVEFKKHNLLRDRYFQHIHMIVCRNVVIYFTDEAKDQVYENFHGALVDDGILFIGSTEQILHAKELGFESLRTFFYKKMKI